MKRQLINVLFYLLLSLILGYLVSIVIAKVNGFEVVETLLWVGIGKVAVGGMSSISGNATGGRIFDGSPDSQYQSFVNIESLVEERKATNFYNNFKKHGIFNPKISTLGIILAGIVLIVIDYFMV